MRGQILQSPRLSRIGRRRPGGGPSLADYAVNGFAPAFVLDFENDIYLGTVTAFADLTTSGAVFDTAVGARRLTWTMGTGSVLIPAAKIPVGPAYCPSFSGEITYGDDNTEDFAFWLRNLSSTNYFRARFTTVSSSTGLVAFSQRETVSGIDSVNSSTTAFGPGANVPFDIAARYGTTFINGAINGVALTEDLTPTALFDGSTVGIELGRFYAGTPVTIRARRFALWNLDIGNAGIAAACPPHMVL